MADQVSVSHRASLRQALPYSTRLVLRQCMLGIHGLAGRIYAF